MLEGDNTPSSSDNIQVKKKIVILLHGINTFAQWTNEVKEPLANAGFTVVPTSFGFLSVLRFLMPIKSFREKAIRRFLSELRVAIKLHLTDDVSVICHSFGTYVVAHSLLEAPEINWKRIVFCGSVVKDDFPFNSLLGRFIPPIINEVGSLDLWPAVAESITWGYGYVGSHGANHPMIETRWHRGFKHSDFLTKEFCEKYWVPFLTNGEIIKADNPSPSKAARIISRSKFRWLIPAVAVLAIIGLLYSCKGPGPVPGPVPGPKPRVDCGTAASGWIEIGGPVGNPCPDGCTRGDELGQSYRSVGFPPRPQTKHNFQCWR